MLAFSAFAAVKPSTAGLSSTLTINAEVAAITPSYKMVASNSTLTLESTASATEMTSHKTENLRADGTAETVTFYLGIAQLQARYNSDVTLTLKFSNLTFKENEKTKTSTETASYTPIPAPTVTTLTGGQRSETVALKVGDLTSGSTSDTENTYTIELDYSIFGYFMPSTTGLMVMKVDYTVPTTVTEDLKTAENAKGYMPLGTYTGTVTLTATSK